MKDKRQSVELKQLQKEARERFDKFWEDIDGCDGCGKEYVVCKKDFHFQSFLDTEIAKAFQAGQESVFKRVNRKLKGWEYTFQGVCQYCSADFWNYDDANHTSQCPMGKLEEVLNIIESLSTEKLKVDSKDEENKT